MKQGLVFRAVKGETLLDTLAQATARYTVKHGCPPQTVYVHPSQGFKSDTLRVVENARVQPNHLWLEIE